MNEPHNGLRLALASALALPAPAQTVWQQVPTPVAPPARTWAAIAHDTVRDRIVLWGGNDLAQWRTDTWEFDGSAWTQRTLVHAPPAARGSMAYDRGRARAVLVTGAGASAATWEYDGGRGRLRSAVRGHFGRAGLLAAAVPRAVRRC